MRNKNRNFIRLMLAAFFLIAFSFQSRSQDTSAAKKALCGDMITFKNESTQMAKVLEVTDKEIVFKRCANLNGPTIRTNKKEIKSIVYLNGMKETFEKTEISEEPRPKPVYTGLSGPVNLKTLYVNSFDTLYPQKKLYPFDSTRHFISCDLFTMLAYQIAGLSYEYIFAKGHLGARAMSSLGLRAGNTTGPYARSHTRYSFGFDLNYYFKKGNFYPGPVKCFIGPSFEYGVFNYSYHYFSYIGTDSVFHSNPPNSYWSVDYKYDTNTEKRVGYQYTVLLKGGMLCRPSRHFNISFTGGFGLIRFNSNYLTFLLGSIHPDYTMGHDYSYRNRMVLKGEINLGYKF